MKKTFLALAVAMLLLPVAALAEERIQEFVSVIVINADATVDVVEKITYDFGDAERHGIYREVPFKYATRLGSYRADIEVKSVAMGNGARVPYTVSRQGGNTHIKIGDPDTYITGAHTYVISYTVEDIISYFGEYDELYWNVTGNEWRVPIGRAAAEVRLEGGEFLQVACYRGAFGAEDACIRSSIGAEGRASFEDVALFGGEGLTIAVGFPKGIVYESTLIDRILKLLRDNWILLLPVVVFCWLLRRWLQKGRDPKGRGTIVPQYNLPKSLTPAQVSLLLNEKVQLKDVTAEILYLAVHGYIKIHQFEKKKLIFTSTEYLLEKRKPADADLEPYQQDLMEGIFGSGHSSTEDVDGMRITGVLLSEMKNKLATEGSRLLKAVYARGVTEGHFVSNPKNVRGAYMGVGFFLIFASFFVAGIFQSLLAGAAIALSGVLAFVFSFAMPALTKKGVALKEHVRGFLDYVHTVERDRVTFHNDPKNTPERFDAILPFAMVLGVEKAWATLFADIYQDAPSWYAGARGRGFDADAFTTDLQGFQSAARSAVAPQSSGSGSGGGGFSGGGGGGGGGGSW